MNRDFSMCEECGQKMRVEEVEECCYCSTVGWDPESGNHDDVTVTYYRCDACNTGIGLIGPPDQKTKKQLKQHAPWDGRFVVGEVFRLNKRRNNNVQ